MRAPTKPRSVTQRLSSSAARRGSAMGCIGRISLLFSACMLPRKMVSSRAGEPTIE